jgi:Spy/CpxP family protein refolding chaperone
MIKKWLRANYYNFIIKQLKEKEMKKKILVASLLAGVLATSGFAYNQDCPNFDQRSMQNAKGMQKGFKQNCSMQGKRGMQRGGGMMPMLANLDLSDEQKYQLSILRDEMRLEMKKSMGMQQRPDFSKFITKDGFDKEAFVKSMDEKHTKMIQIKADHMQKVFKILTKAQIEKLQVKN